MWGWGTANQAKGDPLDVVESVLKKDNYRYERASRRHILTGFEHETHLIMVAIVHEIERKALVFCFNPAETPADASQPAHPEALTVLQVHTACGHTEGSHWSSPQV